MRKMRKERAVIATVLIILIAIAYKQRSEKFAGWEGDRYRFFNLSRDRHRDYIAARNYRVSFEKIELHGYSPTVCRRFNDGRGLNHPA